MAPRNGVACVLVCAFAAACDTARDGVACVPLLPDVPMESSAGEDVDDPGAAELIELWQVGGSIEGQELAVPAAAVASENGTVAVIDYGLAEVAVIDSAGDWLGRWGRRGRGPGELVMPVAATWTGERLAVFDIEQSKVVYFEDGEAAAPDVLVDASFAAPVVMAGEIGFVAIRPDGSVLLQHVLDRGAAAGWSDSALIGVLQLSRGARHPDTVAIARVPVATEGAVAGMPLPGAPVPRVATGTNGWLAYAATDDTYRIVIEDSANGPVRQLCRAVEPLPLTDAEELRIDGELEEARMNAARPELLAGIGRMIVGPRGQVWVDRRRPAPFTADGLYGVAGGTLDAFDEDGRYLGRVQVPPGVRIQAISHGRAFGIRFGSADEPWIVGYRVDWQPTADSLHPHPRE